MSISNEHLLEYNFFFERINLPKGWEVASLAELSFVVTDGTHKTPSYQPSGIRFISIKNIRPFSPVNWGSYEKYISKEEHQELIKRCRPEYDDILFPRIGTLGFAKRIDFKEEVSIFVGLGLIKPVKKYVAPKFLEFYMNTPYISRLSEEKANGTGRMTLPLEESRRFPAPLPPLNEQYRIVAKIEELFSELDAGIESLKTAQAQLKVYRQSLLKHAFEGKLTAQWREQNKDKLESAEALLARIQTERANRYQQQLKEWEAAGKPGSKPKAPKPLPPLTAEELAELPELPEGWGWVRLAHIQSSDKFAVKAGPFGSALKKEYYVPEGYKIYGQEQVIRGDHEYGDYFVNQTKYEELISCAVKPFDILISLVGTIGKVLVLPENIKLGIINPRLVKISLNLEFYKAEFFKAYFESGFLRSLYSQESQGTTMDILNLGIIQSLPYPLCSKSEQEQILLELDSKFSLINQMENIIAESTQKSEALRQSILKKAFSGQLVPQDPNDEPASALLARIKAEKAAQPKSRKVSA